MWVAGVVAGDSVRADTTLGTRFRLQVRPSWEFVDGLTGSPCWRKPAA